MTEQTQQQHTELEKCLIRHTKEQKSFSWFSWLSTNVKANPLFISLTLNEGIFQRFLWYHCIYLSSFFNPSQHSLPYNLWRPPNICHRSVAERCNRGKINLFYDLICPLSGYIYWHCQCYQNYNYLSQVCRRSLQPIISFVPSWPSVIFVTIVNVLTLSLFVTYLSPNIALKVRWIFSIISFLLSWPWVILVNIIDINNTGIWQISVAEHCTQNKTNLPYNLQSLIRLFISHRYCSCMKQCSDLITVLGIRSIFISWRLGRFQETDSSPFCALMYSGWFYGWGKNAKMGKYLSKISLSALKFQHILDYLPQPREARLLNAVNRVKWNHVCFVINLWYSVFLYLN